jgi:hypothetical protein
MIVRGAALRELCVVLPQMKGAISFSCELNFSEAEGLILALQQMPALSGLCQPDGENMTYVYDDNQVLSNDQRERLVATGVTWRIECCWDV